VLSQYCEPDLAAQIIDDARGIVGGRGYMLKERITGPRALQDAVLALRSGQTVMDPTVVARMALGGRRPPVTAPLDVLTPREVEVLQLLASGRSNGSIANELGIARRSVEKYISRVFAKMGVNADASQDPRVAATLRWLQASGDTMPRGGPV